MAELEAKTSRSGDNGHFDTGDGDGDHGLGSLTGMAVVRNVFHFLHGPADVLRASTVSRRWRELACSDAVWRPKAVREGMVEKAGVFEVALPAAAAAAAATAAAAAIAKVVEEDKLAGVGLAFYSQIYALKVMTADGLPLRSCTSALATTTARPRSLTTAARSPSCAPAKTGV